MPEPETDRTRSVKVHILGPGLIAGASDDDPAGIATYSQAGAQFGFALLWLMPFVWPFMSAVQEIAAKIGRTTGHGIAANLRNHYSVWFSAPIVMLLLAANIFNIGADLGAMAAALKLLVGGPAHVYVIAFAVVSVLGVAMMSYRKYAGILRWLTVSLFAYAATAVVAHVPWAQALKGTLVPTIRLDANLLSMIVAVLGTTISPYVFFWQASEEAEDVRLSSNDHALKRHPEEAPKQLRRIRLDTMIGMLFANLVAWFIMLACATTLHAHGITDISSAEQAALALRPLAGDAAFLLFAGGIIGTGLLAVPVLAGSAAYAVGEEMRRRVGIDYSPRRAPYFYSVLAIATLVGAAMNFTAINPIRMLVWSAVINGIVAVPVLISMMLMIKNRRVMGSQTEHSRPVLVLGWLTTILMATAVAAMFLTI